MAVHLNNLTQLAAERAALVGPGGLHVLCVAAKASFAIGADGTLRQITSEEIMRAPRHLSDDPAKTMLRDTELTLDHPGTDILINAVAQTPDRSKVAALDAEVLLDDTRLCAFRVTGDRVWKRQFRSMVPTAPQPFARMPIVYERAFGGTVEGERPTADPRNPVGLGFHSQLDAFEGAHLPNIEHPDHLFTHAETNLTRPVMGLSARPATWEPRRTFAGTYDLEWEAERLPHWPDDLDTRFFRAASPELQLATALRGHEMIELRNLAPGGILRLRVPRLIPVMTIETRSGQRIERRPDIRRIIIEPELGAFHILWRTTIECGPNVRNVRKIVLDQRKLTRGAEQEAVPA